MSVLDDLDQRLREIHVALAAVRRCRVDRDGPVDQPHVIIMRDWDKHSIARVDYLLTVVAELRRRAASAAAGDSVDTDDLLPSSDELLRDVESTLDALLHRLRAPPAPTPKRQRMRDET